MNLARETVVLGWRMFHRDAPWRLIMSVFWVRSVLESLLFCGLAYTAGSAAGLEYAFPGVVVLALTYYTVMMASDIPMRDRWDGTFSRLATGRMSMARTFVLRSVPLVLHSLLAVTVVALVSGALLGQLGQLPSLLFAAPYIVIGAISGIAAGLCIVTPAIGTRLDVVTYNLMAGLIVVCSGAVIPRGTSTVLDAVGTVLPLTHTVAAVRADSASEALRHGVAELAVGCGWAILTFLLLGYMARRGRTLGRGVFA